MQQQQSQYNIGNNNNLVNQEVLVHTNLLRRLLLLLLPLQVHNLLDHICLLKLLLLSEIMDMVAYIKEVVVMG